MHKKCTEPHKNTWGIKASSSSALPLDNQRDAHAEKRVTVDKVGCPIQRVDHPCRGRFESVPCRSAGVEGRLFSHELVALSSKKQNKNENADEKKNGDEKRKTETNRKANKNEKRQKHDQKRRRRRTQKRTQREDKKENENADENENGDEKRKTKTKWKANTNEKRQKHVPGYKNVDVDEHKKRTQREERKRKRKRGRKRTRARARIEDEEDVNFQSCVFYISDLKKKKKLPLLPSIFECFSSRRSRYNILAPYRPFFG